MPKIPQRKPTPIIVKDSADETVLARDQCIACGGTGVSSRGARCVPCRGLGWHPGKLKAWTCPDCGRVHRGFVNNICQNPVCKKAVRASDSPKTETESSTKTAPTPQAKRRLVIGRPVSLD